jgi:hypothetical protein
LNVWRGRPRPRRPESPQLGPLLNHEFSSPQAFAGGGARATFTTPHSLPKGKGQSDFSDWPLLMPATTYAPTHLARAVPSALRGLTSVFGMGTGGSPAVRSPTNRSRRSLVVGRWPFRAKSTRQFPDDKLSKIVRLDTSQLNRLGVAYFLVCLFPISATVLRLCFLTKASAQQLSVLHLSHPDSNDFNNIAGYSSGSN